MLPASVRGRLRMPVRLVHLLAVVAALWIAAIAMPAAASADDGADKVTVGVYINDVQDVVLASNSYTVDFYLWLRWTNPDIDPSQSIEPMNPYGAGGVAVTRLYDAPVDMPDGSKYMAFRYQGRFNNKMSLERYPFDVQSLVLQFEDSVYASSSLQYVPDTTPVTMNAGLAIPGYLVGTPTLTVADNDYPTSFGDISISPSPYSRITITVPVSRPVFPYLVKILLPILILVLITALIYILPARMVEVRSGIGITAMLTMVAMQWTTTNNLPAVEYLMMLDLWYILSLLFILVAMAYTVLTAWMKEHGRDEVALVRLDRRFGGMTLVVYAMALALVMVVYLR